MELKELQIGDIVVAWSPYVIDGDRLCKISEAEFGTMIVDKSLFEDIVLDPVKLTSQMLLKNGFIQIGATFIKTGEFDFILRMPASEESFWFDFGGRQIQVLYVHQLQHLLRDCGMSKEAESITLESLCYADQERKQRSLPK